VLEAVTQLEEGRAEVTNAYARAVNTGGNAAARAVIEQVFEVVDQTWRGIGVIADSGLALRATHAAFDARRRYPQAFHAPAADEPATECMAGAVLSGHKRPDQCPAFGTRCQPSMPLGAPMVSNEGACAAYFRYRRHAPSETRES
jgi:hydrogenase expression/formation protein HypD